MIAGWSGLTALQPAFTVIAQAPASLDLGTGLLTYGPLGIMVAGFMFGQIVPGPTHKRVVEENATLRTLIDDKVWPTINDSTAAMRDATAAVLQSNETAKEIARLLPPDDPPPRRRRAAPQ